MNTNQIYIKAKELNYEDFVSWFDGEMVASENSTYTKELAILEETGYSYSGISDILRNEPERKNELLFAIDSVYCRLRDVAKKARSEADSAEGSLSHVVSCFLYFHKVLKQDGILSEDKLTFSKGDENIIVSIEGSNTIKYAYYKRADF